MTKGIALVVMTFTLASCSSIPGLLGGGGPSLTAVGTQVAKDATQQAVYDQDNFRTDGGDLQVSQVQDTVQTKDVNELTINNQEIPLIYMILMIAGWLAPSPSEMGRGLLGLFSRRKP